MPEDNRYVDNRFQHQQQQNREHNQQLHTHGIKRLVRNNLLHFTRDYGLASFVLGLDRTEHMTFLTGLDRIPKFAGQVLPDWTKSRLILLKILHTK
jgi:hypothetical protein